MGCGCGCNSNKCGMGAMVLPSLFAPNLFSVSISPRFGLRGLGELLKAGTPISQGFQVGLFNSQIDDAVNNGDFEGCLYRTGAFSSVKVSQSGYLDVYLQVDGTPSIDFGAPQDLQSIIISTLGGCIGKNDLIKKIYEMSVGNPPEEFRNDPNVQQSTYQQQFGIPMTRGQAPPGAALPDKPDTCKFDSKGKEREGFDYLSCKLGLGSSSGGATTLILLLVGAVVVSKALNK